MPINQDAKKCGTMSVGCTLNLTMAEHRMQKIHSFKKKKKIKAAQSHVIGVQEHCIAVCNRLRTFFETQSKLPLCCPCVNGDFC